MAPGQKAGSLCRSLCGNRLVSLSGASSRSPRRGMAPGQKAGSLCRSLCGNRLVSLSEASSRSPRRGNGTRSEGRQLVPIHEWKTGWLA